ncbi:YpzI family protein [Oceanobacillus sp. CF4.6]|uniref:YpzI family protein n=1 Tax=Oceanobacillus sp. CF4.6 TaxID=3373080 RepID=UPI003EE598A4
MIHLGKDRQEKKQKQSSGEESLRQSGLRYKGKTETTMSNPEEANMQSKGRK